MMRIGDVLASSMKRRGYGKKISEAMIFLDYPELVGEQIAKVTRPLHLKDGIMFIGVESPVWSHHLHFFKPEIMKKLNSQFDRKLVKDIKFQIRTLDKDDGNYIKPINSSDNVQIPENNLDWICRTCHEIEDEQLRAKFKQLMTKDAGYKLTKTEGAGTKDVYPHRQ